MNDEFQTQTPIVNFAPDRWFADRKNSSVWLTGFEVARSQIEDSHGALVDLGQCVVLIGAGALSYFDPGELSDEFGSDDVLWMSLSKPGFKQTSKRPHVLILTPHDIDGVPGVEQTTRQRVSSFAALIAAICGQNSIYRRLFDNLLKADGSGLYGFSPIVANPRALPEPNFTAEQIGVLARAGGALSSMSGPDLNRCVLSLHWYEKSLRSMDIDALLKAWIAIEVLAMEDGSNISPINVKLAKAYEITTKEATKEFYVGRLFGLRCRIVHSGEMVDVHSLLQRYLSAIFCDLLFHHLGIASEHSARQVLADGGSELVQLLCS